MAHPDPLDDVVDRLVRSTPLSEAMSRRVVEEVVAAVSEPVDDLLRRRHRELQADGLANPEIFDRLFSARHDRAVNRLSDLFAALFFAGMGLVAVHFVAQSAEFGDKAAIFYFPLWPIQLVMPYAFFSCAFRHLAYALHPELRPQGVLA